MMAKEVHPRPYIVVGKRIKDAIFRRRVNIALGGHGPFHLRHSGAGGGTATMIILIIAHNYSTPSPTLTFFPFNCREMS